MNQATNLSVKIIGNRVDFFFAVNSEDIAVVTLEADLGWLKRVCPIPQRIRDSLPEGAPGRAQRVWQKKPPVVGKDLGEAVRLCFDSQRPQGIVHYRITKQALGLLNGHVFKTAKDAPAASTAPSQLHVKLSGAATERLNQAGEENPPALRIDTIHLYQFPTGLTIPVLSLSLSDPSAMAQLQELVHGLSQYAKLRWREPQGYETAASFGVAELMQSLLGLPEQKSERLYTAAIVVMDGITAAQDLRLPLRKLARHYQSDYRLGESDGSDIVLDEFANRTTVAALEGIAFGLFTQDAKPTYLASFAKDAYQTTYLPLLLLAFHQHQALKHYNGIISGWTITPAELLEKREALNLVQDAIGNFRNNYMTPLVSTVSMHNQHYRAFRQALHIDELTGYLNQQTGDLMARLEAHLRHQTTQRQEAHETRVCKWGALGVGAAALVTMHTIVHELLVSLHNSFHLLHAGEKHFGLISIGTALLVAVAAWAVQRKACRQHAAKHHGPTHALIHEHTIHKALRGPGDKGH